MTTEQSSATPRRDSTRSITATEANCRQIAAVLFVDVEPVKQAFLAEPLQEVMAMVCWALEKESDPRFDPAKALPCWAKKRGRGYWRDTREPELAQALDEITREDELACYWSENRSFIIRELDRMAGNLIQCCDCHARRELRYTVEIQEEQAENGLGLVAGERMCTDCAGKHGLPVKLQ